MKPSKNINLLPLELRYGFFRKIIYYNESHPKETLIYTTVTLCVLALAISLTQAVNIKKYSRKMQRTEHEVRRLQAKNKEGLGLMNQIAQTKQALEFQSSLLNKRLAFLKGQYNFGHQWAMTLRELKRIIPKGLWLTGIKTEDYYLKIAGGALDEKAITDFMTVLQKSPAFSNVSFNYTQNSQVGKTKVVLFELTCNCNLQYITK